MRTTAALTLTLALALSACSGDPAPTETTAEEPTDAGGDTGGAAGGSLTFVGTDSIAWEQASASVAPGTVEVTIECGEAVNHEVAIEGVQGGEPIAACDAGGTGSGSVELEPGSYTFFCAVPGHREEGMEGELTAE